MKKAILMFALFPFLHATSYSVDYVSCKTNAIIVKHEDEAFQVSLFNTKITKAKGWECACSLVKNAKKLRIEIDPSSRSDGIVPVYLFADDVLVQEELIKKNYAYPMIHNPEYTYESRLEDAMKQTTAVMAEPESKTGTHRYAIIAPLYLGAIFVLWLIMFFWMLRSRRKKVLSKTSKTAVKR